MTIAIILVLLFLGSLIFFYISPWYFTANAFNWKGMEDVDLTVRKNIWGEDL